MNTCFLKALNSALIVGAISVLAGCTDPTLSPIQEQRTGDAAFIVMPGEDAGDTGGSYPTACGAVETVTWEFWRAEDSYTFATTAANITVGQRMMVRITARDRNGCLIPNTQYSSVSSTNSSALRTEFVSFTDTRLTALQFPGTSVQLAVTIGGIEKRTTMFMYRPTLRLEPNALTVAQGGSANLALRAYDNLNRTIRMDGWSGAWTSDNAAVARVEQASVTGDVIMARVTGLAAGNTYARVVLFGERAASAVSVSAVVVASVEIQGSGSLTKGEQRTYTAVARDANGNVLSGLPVSWATANASIATVTQNGTVTAVAAGNTTLSATIGGKPGQLTLTVTAPISPPDSCLDCKTPWVPGIGFEFE
jgi:hypothetical protein